MENMTEEYQAFRDDMVAQGMDDYENGRVVSSEEMYRSIIETALKAEKEGRLAA